MKLVFPSFVLAFLFSLTTFSQSKLDVTFKTVKNGKSEKITLIDNNVIYQKSNVVVSFTIPEERVQSINKVIKDINLASYKFSDVSDVASGASDAPLVTSMVIKKSGKVYKSVFNEVNPPQELRNLLAIMQDFSKQ